MSHRAAVGGGASGVVEPTPRLRAAPPAAAIDIEGVSKRFGDALVLDRVSLRVAAGEVVALLGPNGSGKSTLLRTLAGVVTADSGMVSLCGHDVVADRQGASRRVGLILDGEASWYTRISGRANLEFFAALRGLDRRAARQSAAAGLELVGLGAEGGRPVSEYSAGMRARLALARARLGDPEVMLLDEPSARLDARSAHEMRRRLAESRGAGTVLLATHDPREAALADRAVVLDHGRLDRVIAGPLSEVGLRDELEAPWER